MAWVFKLTHCWSDIKQQVIGKVQSPVKLVGSCTDSVGSLVIGYLGKGSGTELKCVNSEAAGQVPGKQARQSIH